jgi:hypothetical protein
MFSISLGFRVEELVGELSSEIFGQYELPWDLLRKSIWN